MGYNQTMLHSLRLFTDPSALSLKKVNIFYLRSISELYCKRELVGTIRMLEIAVPISHCLVKDHLFSWFTVHFFHLTAPNIVKAPFCHRIVMCFCEIYCFIIQHNVKDIFWNCVKQQKTDVLSNWFSPNWCGWLVAENPTWRIMLAESGILFCLSSAIFSQHS